MKRIIIYAKVTIISDNNNILLKGRGLKLIIFFLLTTQHSKLKSQQEITKVKFNSRKPTTNHPQRNLPTNLPNNFSLPGLGMY